MNRQSKRWPTSITCLLIAMMAAFLRPSLVQAQTSELYLTYHHTPRTYVVQNRMIVRQFSRDSTRETAFVVQDTIKMVGQDPGDVGFEYDLQGNRLSGQYLNPEYRDFYDGATDGQHNWSIPHNDWPVDFAVVQSDADWDSPRLLFVPEHRSKGIAYDANNDTLWLLNYNSGIAQYALSGEKLSEFPVPDTGLGLAWDPADDTLWVPHNTQFRRLSQYDKQGNLLQSFSIPGLQRNGPIHGAEFQVLNSGTANPDLNGDGMIDCLDVDSLVTEIVAGTNSSAFDLTGDGLVDTADLDEWRVQGGATNLPSGNPYLIGDANLDGGVDGQDFIHWNENKFTATAAWCSGDFNADGAVDGQDFILWNANKFVSSDNGSAVPEPGIGVLWLAALIGLAVLRQRYPWRIDLGL